MPCAIRALITADQPFLWEILYHAIYIPAGKKAPDPAIVYTSDLARYVEEWGRAGDYGYLAINKEGQPIGAVWLRRWSSQNRGYGYLDENTPELSMAVLPSYRGQGVGTALLTKLFDSAWGKHAISLSVSKHNPALLLYECFGFKVVVEGSDSFIMCRNRCV